MVFGNWPLVLKVVEVVGKVTNWPELDDGVSPLPWFDLEVVPVVAVVAVGEVIYWVVVVDVLIGVTATGTGSMKNDDPDELLPENEPEDEVLADPDVLVEPEVEVLVVPVVAAAPPKTPKPYNNPKIKAKRTRTPNNGHNHAGHPPFLVFFSTTCVVTTGL